MQFMDIKNGRFYLGDCLEVMKEIPVREGVVFKCVTNGDISFKAISNKFLLKGGD